MIKLTAAAAAQIAKSATADVAGLPLRISVVRDAAGQFQYGMGFDDQTRPDDQGFESEGIRLVVSAVVLPLLKDMTVDYVRLDDGDHHFIFLNPNDPAYVPPQNG